MCAGSCMRRAVRLSVVMFGTCAVLHAAAASPSGPPLRPFTWLHGPTRAASLTWAAAKPRCRWCAALRAAGWLGRIGPRLLDAVRASASSGCATCSSGPGVFFFLRFVWPVCSLTRRVVQGKKGNNEISRIHFRKDWARHVRLWLNQPGKKKVRCVWFCAARPLVTHARRALCSRVVLHATSALRALRRARWPATCAPLCARAAASTTSASGE